MILFVDDEDFRVENDVEELRLKGWPVHLVNTVDEAVKFLEARRKEVQCVICDVMMPHGTYFSADETRNGLRTGVKLFEWARKCWPDLPFVIFTNVSEDEGLRRTLEGKSGCVYVEKTDCLGEEILRQVSSLIAKTDKESI